MDYKIVQDHYDKIYSYFKTTTEPFDSLEWDGKVLEAWNKDKITEIYKYNDLRSFIKNL